MQQPYGRPFPQRSPHAAAQSNSRRGIGQMIPAGGQQNSMTQAQLVAHQQNQQHASERSKIRARKPTDKNIPEGIEECIIGDGVQRYRDLRDLERRLDATMMKKRMDLQDAVNRNVKRSRTLRIWISNTVEDQPWQADALDTDAFDFSANMDSSYRVNIEGRLLDEEESEDSDDEDEDEAIDADVMDEDGKEATKKSKTPPKEYKFSYFFKAMTVEFDRNRKSGSDQSVEWKKPVVAANATNLPNAADFDQLEFKRRGDDNLNITINLVRDEHPERYELKPALADILDTKIATKGDAVTGVWEYVKAMGLQDDIEARSFECDERLKLLLIDNKGNVPDKSSCPELEKLIGNHLTPLPPIKLPYTIRVDKAFHDDPQPTIYDVEVLVDDPLKAALTSYLTNPVYAQNLLEITSLNDHVALVVQKIMNSKSKHQFFEDLSKNPTEFIAKWLSSQKRDLEIVSGAAPRGGGEDVSGDEWRRGGKNGIWGSDNVKESVNLMVKSKRLM